METSPSVPPAGSEEAKADFVPPLHLMRQSVQSRIFAGLLFASPILLTFWAIHWLFSTLQLQVIDPTAALILTKIRWTQPDHPLPVWFEFYAAPVLAILVILVFLYSLGFFVNTRLRENVDWLLLRVPVISSVYDGLRSIFQTLERQPAQQGPTKMVLVEFPHKGIKVPAFITATCQDIETKRMLCCVYVPTTPVPTSGFFLLVPQDDVIELNWSMEQALQAVMSGGLTAPKEVRFFKSEQRVAAEAAAEAALKAATPSA